MSNLTRRDFLRQAALAGGAVGAAGALNMMGCQPIGKESLLNTNRDPAGRKRPHIVIFNPDEWRADVLGHMGNAAALTPRTDEFARRDGVSFSSAFCQNPVCRPSRCSFMTGWYPHTAGHRTMFHMLRPHEPNLLRSLRREGYFVWWGGKNDLAPGQNGFADVADIKYSPGPTDPAPARLLMEHQSPADKGYYSMFWGQLQPPAGRDAWHSADQAYVDGACDFLRHAPADKPLVVYLPLQYPHPPYAVEEPFFSMIDRAKLPPRRPAPPGWRGKPASLKGIAERQRLEGLTEEQWTELRAVYYGMCARVDRQFGQVRGTLRECGQWDDTAVFLFSDHGDFTGDYGLVEKTQNTFEDCLTRVPLMVKPPAGVPVRPRVSDARLDKLGIQQAWTTWPAVGPERHRPDSGEPAWEPEHSPITHINKNA